MSFGSLGSFLVGTDLSMSISDAFGNSIVLDGRLTRFTQKPEDHLVKTSPIDQGGLPDHRVLADGWSGAFEVDRNSDSFDTLMAAQDANFFAGGDQQYYAITIKTPNKVTGGVTRRQFLLVVFHAYDPGEYVKTSATKATVQFASQQRTAL